jgi:hypothetical protein
MKRPAASDQVVGAVAQKKRRPPRSKHVPQRMCIACRTTAPKRSFVRLVRLPTGEVVIDPTGKRSGRGASICTSRSCWQKALAGGLIDHALQVKVRPEDRAVLQEYLTGLPAEPVEQTEASNQG